MDFFVTDTIEPSHSRSASLRNVQQLVSQRIDVLRRNEESAEQARELLVTVARLREAADEAGRVAESAVHHASTMTGDVVALDEASAAVGEGIRTTGEIIGRLDEVQTRIGEVLGGQERMAQLIEAAG